MISLLLFIYLKTRSERLQAFLNSYILNTWRAKWEEYEKTQKKACQMCLAFLLVKWSSKLFFFLKMDSALTVAYCLFTLFLYISVANISHSSHDGLQHLKCGEKNSVLSLSMKGLFSKGRVDWVIAWFFMVIYLVPPLL